MTSSSKFNAMLASVTVLLMFVAVRNMAPQLSRIGGFYAPLLPVAGLLTSAGLFRFLSVVIRWLMGRSQRVNAWVFGPEYIHGTWVGWFRGHSNELRYMVEHFTQDLDGVAISGRSFTDEKQVHGYWFSDAVSVDARRGRLVFTYSFDVLAKSTSLSGIHTSLLERASSRDAPRAYSGFAHDLNDRARIAVHSRNISRDLVPWEEALAKAREMFKNV